MTITAQIIPIQPVPAQTLNITLNNQVCQINIYAKSTYIPITPPGAIITDPPSYVPNTSIYMDLFMNDTLIIGGVIARNGVGIVQNSYFGFIGDIAIEDMQGKTDPVVAELGGRYKLTYWYNA